MDKKFKCTICYEKYASLEDLEGHWAVHFRHYGAPKYHEANKSSKNETEIEKEFKECNQCGFKTKFNIALKRHLKKIHVDIRKQIDKHESPDGDKINSVKNIYVNPSASMKTPSNECSKCEYKTNQRWALRRHERIVHENIKVHECNLCEYKASEKRNLQNHIKAVHDKIKDHKCDLCDLATGTVSILTQHIKAVHERSKDQQCIKCDFKSSYKNKLTRHIRTVHDKIKEYKCTKCEFSTGRSDKLIRHVRAVHDKIKNYKCTKCGYATTRGDHLIVHARAVHDQTKAKMNHS